MNKTSNDTILKLKKHIDLGHVKRDKAFLRQVAFLCSSPGASTPQASGKAEQKVPIADALSMYRFAGNEKISLADLRVTRAKAVLDNLESGSDLLLIHDMSPLDYSRHNSKSDRRLIGNHKGKGYEYVACLAVDPKTRTTLGVLHDTVINTNGPDDKDVMNYDYEPLFADFSLEEKIRLTENHRHQMAVHINGTASLLSNYNVIDVGDREFDDIFILDSCHQNSRNFVIRSTPNRNVQIQKYDWLPESITIQKAAGHAIQPEHLCVNLNCAVDYVPLQPYQTLPLDVHNRVVEASSAKRFAKLSIGTFRIVLYRNAKRNKQHFHTPHPVEVNVVIIRESDPPPDCNPLCWILFTSLPVETYEQMAYVGLIYELRWLIENFFKLLKSGYGLPESRLNNADKIARFIVVLTLAAMTILHLKQKIGLPGKGNINNEDYQRVKTAMLHPDNTDIDLNLRLFAFIAKNGGWLGRRRDPIGPTILMRGMLHLLAVFDSFVQYSSLIEEALRHPDILQNLLNWHCK